MSEGLWPGRYSTRSVRSRSFSSSPAVSGRSTSTVQPHARKLAETARSAVTTSVGTPWRSMMRAAKRSSSSDSLAEVAQPAVEALQGRHLRAGAPREDRGEADVVDVLVGDHQQLQVLDRVPARGERLFELVERLGGVGPGVDQRERVVLDQVGVDAAHREGRGDREAVDALRRGALQRGCLIGLLLRGLRAWGS